jgi:hypothetical protein
MKDTKYNVEEVNFYLRCDVILSFKEGRNTNTFFLSMREMGIFNQTVNETPSDPVHQCH